MQRRHTLVTSVKDVLYLDIVLSLPNVGSYNLQIGGQFGSSPQINLPYCNRVKIIDLGVITKCWGMFQNMPFLEIIDGFDFSSVDDFTFCFIKNSKLKYPPFTSIFATTYTQAFYNSNFENINLDLNNSVTRLDQAFQLCEATKILLTNTTGLNNVYLMVGQCPNLIELTIDDMSLVTDMSLFAFQTTKIQKALLTGLTVGVDLSGNNMDSTALNNLFTSLGIASGSQTITITGNPGVSTCDTSIATGKGFTIAS